MRIRQAIALVLALALACIPFGPAEGTTDPVISLTPPVGPPTSRAVVNGMGFGPQERVDLRFDTGRAGRAWTDVSGTFSTRIEVPAQALPGEHAVTARGRVSGLTATATFTVRTDWAQFHFDPAHTGHNPYENVLDPSTVPDLSLAWRSPVAPSEASTHSSVAVVGGRTYVAGTGDLQWAYVNAFDGATGALLWQTSIIDGGLALGVAVADGRVFVPTLQGSSLHALDADTGEELWVFQASGAMTEPAVFGGVVYSGSNTNDLYAIDAATGEVLWQRSMSHSLYVGPAVSGGMVYVGTVNGNIYAVDALTGAKEWFFPTGGEITSIPAVSGGVVYVGSANDNFYALDAATGEELWRAPTGGSISSDPAVAGGVVYVGSFDSYVYAFDAVTGEELWRTPLGGGVFQAPSVANGVVYVGCLDHRFYALNAATGEVLWSYLTDGVLANASAVADGTVYTGSQDGFLYAFRLP